MSKALEILKDVVEQPIGEGIFAPMTEVEVQNFFFEAIAELKAMEARIKELEAELKAKDWEFRTLQETAIRIDGQRIKLKEELDNLKDNK